MTTRFTNGMTLKEPLYNEVLGIMYNILPPGQRYSEMYRTGRRYNKPRYNEILVVTSTTQKPKRKMSLDITNKCQQATEKLMRNKPKRMKCLSNFSNSFLLLILFTCSVFQCRRAMYRSVQYTIASCRY